ncbi:MAG: tetratricopeptide repeat protein [Flavobacteriales bacterium]|nr:tetratricopeptide repeat protein [Flavobacteriales bacterium]
MQHAALSFGEHTLTGVLLLRILPRLAALRYPAGVALLPMVALGVALICATGSFAQPASADGITCAQHVDIAKKLLPQNADSALMHALEAEKCMSELKTSEEKVRVFIVLGDAQQNVRDMPAALGAYQRAQRLVDEAQEQDGASPALALARVDIAMNIGLLHFNLRDLDKSIQHYTEALHILDGAAVQDSAALASRKVRLFNNMAAVYIRRSDFATALPYFQQALLMNRSLNDARNAGSLNNNIGICLMELGDHEQANEYFLKSLAARKELDDARGQAQVLNNLGKNQVNFGHFTAARDHFEQALSIGQRIGSPESMVISLESLSLVYDTLGEHQAALKAHRAFKTLNDSLYNADSRLTIARLEEEFRRDKERDLFRVEGARKDAENARHRIWNFALAGALFFLALTTFLVFKVLRQRVRTGRLEQEKLRLEREKLEAEQDALQENLASKDRELTANALFLLKRNELIAHITERLLKAKPTFRQENQQVIQEIVRDLQASHDEHNWKEFEAHFTRVHSSFYSTLQERFPELTPNERKLCAFLRLNMSTKDISAITQQTLNSITVARSRLRKKLGIEGEETNLVDFLQSV